ncbi:hypothetical protein Kpho01_24360 [Kitasatospora phosalacinea]|uniref:Uncharacterized protein n=1 Tax=Kitasatospora phosalacinea TaxID=2065 RepID=A0A9W6PED2_9ACTN|nr:hypothetical protein Kpho01_24360 [Kitasatospora phosalacinea]
MGSPMIASHSGVGLPEAAEAASTVTSMLPLSPRIAFTALVIVSGTTAPDPFMVYAGPLQAVRATSLALPWR